MRKNVKNKLRIVNIAVAMFFLLELFRFVGFFQSIENLSYDLRMKWSSIQQAESDIVIVAIDDKSLLSLGRWPWDRQIHTELVEKIVTQKPRTLVFDVLFSEASMNPNEDQNLAEAMESLGVTQVVLAQYAQFSPFSQNGKLVIEGIVEPVDAFDKFQRGHINTIPDEDGVVRKSLHTYTFEGKTIPSIDKIAVESHTGFAVEDQSIPTDFLNRWNIPFIKGNSYPIYSYIDVLEGKLPQGALEDKLVLVGPMSVGLSDHYPVPTQNSMYGVVVHAHTMDALLHDRFLKPVGMDALWVLAFILVGLLYAHRLSMRMGIILLFLTAGGYSLLTLLLMEYQHLILTTVAPLAGLVLSYAANIGLNYYLEKQEREQVTRLFGRFVAPQVVDEILRLGEQGIKLGGVRKEISVLFLDVRGFTPLSEKMEPEEIVDVLNSFFDDITKAIFEHGGTLDKFIGDAVMAIYNAPLELENHEVQAVRTAIQIQRRAQIIQRQLEAKYGRTVAFGIGVNCGSAVVGKIGAMERLDYTAIGDTVNLAARLESNAKPNQIIISQKVFEKIQESGADDIQMTPMGSIQVKGKSEPVEIYEVHHHVEETTKDKVAM